MPIAQPQGFEKLRVADLVQRGGLAGFWDPVVGEALFIVAGNRDELLDHVSDTRAFRGIGSGDEIPALERAIAPMCNTGAAQIPDEEVVRPVIVHLAEGAFRRLFCGIFRHQPFCSAILVPRNERPSGFVEMPHFGSAGLEQRMAHGDKGLDRHESWRGNTDGQDEQDAARNAEPAQDHDRPL